MKVLIAACMVLLAGCDIRVIPLKSAYRDDPYEFSIADSRQMVWNKLIDLFTTKGLAIKMLDENSGLITTDNISFLHTYTWEKRDGSLTDSAAFVVCNKIRGPFTFPATLGASSVTGQWIVRIKQESGKVLVDVKLANALAKFYSQPLALNGQVPPLLEDYTMTVKSTGVFEKTVENALR